MLRGYTLAIGLLALVARSSRADDTITPETVSAVKDATAYIRVAGNGWAGSGAGFVVGLVDGEVPSSLQPEINAAESSMAERPAQVLNPRLILTDELLVKVVSILPVAIICARGFHPHPTSRAGESGSSNGEGL